MWRLVCASACVTAAVFAGGAGGPLRNSESVLAPLSYDATCSSTIELHNVADRAVVVDIEVHRSSGALAGLKGLNGNTVRLGPGERGTYRADIDEDTGGVWVKVRERMPPGALSPAIAVGGHSECVVANELHTAARQVAYPLRSPWFSGDVAELRHGAVVSLINTSPRPAIASICYSSGSIYAVPDGARPPRFQPVCSTEFDEQVPPFGSRQYAVQHEGSSHFSLKTQGDRVVLQMLAPVVERVNLYTVDSTITFGGEAPGSR